MPIDIPLLSTFGITNFNSLEISSFGYFTGESSLILTIPNHAERAIDLLVQQFRQTAPKLISAITGIAHQVQDVESVCNELISFRYLDTATGVQLDRLGALVGILRTSTDDEVYRADIRNRIFINVSGATAEAIIQAARAITGVTDVQLQEIFPATIKLFLNGLIDLPQDLHSRLKQIVAGGVGLVLLWIPTGLTPFGFASESGIPVDNDGFGEWDTGTNDFYEESGIPVGGQFIEGYTN